MRLKIKMINIIRAMSWNKTVTKAVSIELGNLV
jgi:hypothetical protein